MSRHLTTFSQNHETETDRVDMTAVEKLTSEPIHQYGLRVCHYQSALQKVLVTIQLG